MNLKTFCEALPSMAARLAEIMLADAVPAYEDGGPLAGDEPRVSVALTYAATEDGPAFKVRLSIEDDEDEDPAQDEIEEDGEDPINEA